MSTFNSALHLSPSIKNPKSKLLSHECRICGAPAEHLHFGAISCDSCKIFFRRNGNAKQTKFTCDLNDQCEININNRHICKACRLAKCIKCGMSTAFFRAPRSTQPNTKTLVKVQTHHQPKQLSTLNILQSDRSLLSSNQWTLLSDVCNGYKESQLLSSGQRLIDINKVTQCTDVIYQKLVQEFLTCIYETTGTYIRYNDDLCKLSSNDRSIMLHNAANNVSCTSWSFIMNHCHLLSLAAFSNAMKIIYGQRSVDIHLWAMKFIDSDIVLVKLALSLFAFSENTYSYFPNISLDLTNPINILKIQNKYAELTWRYLLYKYDHYQAVRRFLKIISWLEAMNIFLFHAQSLTVYVNDINSLVEQTELTLILDDMDQIFETNNSPI